MKNVKTMKYKKCTPGQKELLNLFNDLFDIILTDKTLESESREDENEKLESKNENEDEDKYETEDENEDDDDEYEYEDVDKTMDQNKKTRNNKRFK